MIGISPQKAKNKETKICWNQRLLECVDVSWIANVFVTHLQSCIFLFLKRSVRKKKFIHILYMNRKSQFLNKIHLFSVLTNMFQFFLFVFLFFCANIYKKKFFSFCFRQKNQIWNVNFMCVWHLRNSFLKNKRKTVIYVAVFQLLFLSSFTSLNR